MVKIQDQQLLEAIKKANTYDIPQVIYICGDYEQKKNFEHWHIRKTLDGYIVLAMHYPKTLKNLTDEQREYARISHFKKVDMSDVVFVYNCGGFISKELGIVVGYAIATNKPIEFAYNRLEFEDPNSYAAKIYADQLE